MCPRNLLKSLLCLQPRREAVMLEALLVLYGCIASVQMEILTRGPSFVVEPPDRMAFSNSSGTTIPCAAEGFPHPMISWVKPDGEILQDMTGLRYMRHDGTLVFPPFPAEEYRADIHAAVYRCEASNTIGVIGSRDVHVTAGTYWTHPSNNPHLMISWIKLDGEILQYMTGLRYMRHDDTFVFPPFTAEEYRADIHAAVYRCKSSNTIGVIGFRDVHVTAVLSHSYEIQLFDEFVLRGNLAILHCPVPSYAGDYMKVTSWERMDGFLVTPSIVSGKYGILDNGDLFIKDTTEHDGAYSFRCHLENVVTKEKKMSKNYARVIVSEPHHTQPPRITKRINRVTFQAGDRATLACVAQGYPVPNYRWRRHFGEELSMPGLGSATRQENGILVFDSIIASNSGKYSCYVSNSMGEDEMSVDVIVEEDLQTSIVPKVLQTDIDKNASFNCSIIGGPIDTVLWKKDMKLLENNARISFPIPTVLKIAKVSRQDAGMYQCFALREHRVSQGAAQLIINDIAPKFKSTFPEKIIRSGSYVSLMCVASGNPAPQIKWTLDGIWPLSTRPGVLVSTYLSNPGDVFSYVNITSVDVKDSGVYSCEASNDAGSVTHARRLNVFGTLFIRSLNNLSALSGEIFSVICPYGGYPFDTIVWKRDGRQLPINQRQKVFPNGTLQIESMESGADDGLYSCEVTYGQEAPISRTFSVIIRTQPRVSNISFPANLHEGMRTAVTCIVLSGDPPITLKWFKDDLPLNERDLDASILFAGNGFVSTLTINTLDYKHNGNYTCVAMNDVGSGAISSRLVVKVRPRWILEPRDTSAVAGRAARLDCQADGVPQPHVRWKMSTSSPPDNFKTIVSSSHVHILVNGSLNFRSVEPFDEGSYLCEANNGVGNGLSTVVKLTVHSAPRFDSKFGVQTARRGDKVFLTCNAYGDSPITFTWRKNGLIIDPFTKARYSQTTELLHGGEGVQVIIEKVEREDTASFTCTATNDFGEDSMNFQLTIQDVPDAPQNLEVHDVGSRSVRLTWSRPFDGNSPILRYTAAWRQLKEQSAGGPLTAPGDETTLTIRGLNPKTRYFFRVMCENILGESQYGAEVAVTTLEEPPREAPVLVKASALSSRAINVTWQRPANIDGSSSIDGFYVGYKVRGGTEPFTFKSVNIIQDIFQHFELYNLKRHTEYIIIVQPFNSRGAGPPSEETEVRTLEFDTPGTPTISSYYTTSQTIKLSWDINITPDAPVSGYILHHRLEGNAWQETRLRGELNEYILHDLQCGTRYFCYVEAFNNAGYGNVSETIQVKTDGSAPIAPDKRFLLNLNFSTLFINLNSWHNGGCPIRFFIIQYKANGQQDWTLVSNNIIPQQQNITIMDLIPGTWYSLMMKARNDAGTTDAEYVFATLTTSGEYPPRPSEISEIGGSFYRHLLITVPVVSSAVVLIVVLCVVCLITRRRTTGRQNLGSIGTDINDHVKPESMPLSSTYESGQEPAYFPTPYAASRVPGYNRESCGPPGVGNQQNMGTFGSSRSGYTYDIPYPRKMEKSDANYESPIAYFPVYSKEHQRISSCELSSKMRRSSIPWRGVEESPSSGESDDGRILCRQDEIILKEESRESETECDRIWKSLEECKYEANKRWVEHAVSIIT